MIERDEDQPLLRAEGLSKWYGKQLGFRDVSFALYPGEVIAVVGESGSGKTTLLQLLFAQLAPTRGRVLYCMRDGATRDLALLGEAGRRFLFRTDWGYVHQDPTLGLRMTVSAGANVGERLIAIGWLPARVVTRPPSIFEDNEFISLSAFEQAAADGAFAFWWSAHGHMYGIPLAIDFDIEAGRTVVCNVSRTVVNAV